MPTLSYDCTRSRRELAECVEADEHYSPMHDTERLKIGVEYEGRLRDHLDRRVCFNFVSVSS